MNVYVRDQERALQFYLDKLDFTLAFDARLQTGKRWVAVSPPDGSTVLTLIEPEPESEACELIGTATQVVFVTDDVPAKYREWRERGVQFRHTPRLRRVRYDDPARLEVVQPKHSPVWGGVFTRFEDLDGNSFALVSFDEVSEAIEAQRRAVFEKQERDRRVAQELDIARQVQARLFPQNLPELQSLDYSGVCMQARHVGGDYFDFLNLGSERLGLIVGDIAGKGIAAALLMANLQANLRSQCAIALDQPQKFLKSVNQLFYENTAGAAYATLFFAEYDDRVRRLRYANCGHLSGLLFRKDSTLVRLDSTSTVLGLFSDWECAVSEVPLYEGDTLALYTDGITESFNERDEEFGEQRLVEILREQRELPTRALMQSILDGVRGFSPYEQHDDITLIVAKCRNCG